MAKITDPLIEVEPFGAFMGTIIFTAAGDARGMFNGRKTTTLAQLWQRTKFRAAVTVVEVCGTHTIDLLQDPADPDRYWPAYFLQQFIDAYAAHASDFADLTESDQLAWQSAANIIHLHAAHLPHSGAPTINTGLILWCAAWALFDVDIYTPLREPNVVPNALRWAYAIVGWALSWHITAEDYTPLADEAHDLLITEVL